MEHNQTILFISGISTLVLVILTGIYVYLTSKLVRSSIKANQQNQRAIREQIRVATAPYLRCNVYQLKDKVYFKLSNIGKGPAYNIDLLALGHYHGEDFDISQFTAKNVNGDLIAPKLDEEGFFHLYDRACYGYIFPRSEVNAPFAFPERPPYLSILFQYRDLSGDNFVQVYYFSENYVGPKKFYKLIVCDPDVITTSPRIEFEFERMRLVVKQGKELSGALKKAKGYQDFEKSFKLAVSSGFFIGFLDFEIEDRGEYKNI